MDYYIAVDIGGTQLRAALYPEGEQKAVSQKRIPTQTKDQSPVDRLLELIKNIMPSQGKVKAIGMAAPGPINPKTGILYAAPNIPGWVNLPLAQIVQDRFKVPTLLGNDANLAAMGEWKFGAGRGYQHLLYMTVSTGIGGGVIEEGKLLLGYKGLAAEIGHITVDPNGPLCGCGQRGHLEALASGTAIARYVSEQLASGVPSSMAELPAVTARDVSLAAEQGDPLAREALARAGRYLGRAIADFLHLFNPQIVIIGGGVSRSGRYFLDPLRNSIAEYVISPEYLHGLVVTTASLGDDAGLLGALALAQTVE
ncbi:MULTISPECIES: ROK family protein [Anaerolinea]|uniref:Glucokinase n=1 Tax=Anaerolinea thermophila (strain DSM 14523 / JCM 11388 / NBRC 100420 / UNI-1) TaxID=926569 RepID=E8N4J5_ANATU|nr:MULTISPECIES: ROK family protein [Anaerolinea]BAJ63359.1 glucokinase [Anaerolinea thermophila UNI-1]